MSDFRAGYVGIIGYPNAGKSSFLNLCLKEDLSMVTEKPQMTRKAIVGIHNISEGQIVFVDAPGIIRSEKGINRFIEKEWNSVIDRSDVLLGLISLDQENPSEVQDLIDVVKSSGKPFLFVINKMDLEQYHRRIPAIEQMVGNENKVIKHANLGKEQEGSLAEIESAIHSSLPSSPGPLYPPETITTSNMREICSEIIRKNCFELLRQELPYSLGIRVIKYDESQEGMTRIFSEILVSREGHKPIVIGSKGSRLKEIGTRSRKEMENWVEGKIYLELSVKVRKNWMENSRIMDELGYGCE